MSELRFERWPIPVADFGTENPYPPLQAEREPVLEQPDSSIPQDMQQNLRYGKLRGTLPYTMQDGYTRHRTLQQVRVAVLENETLRAGFLPDYGGRLWSLVHKPSGRELLYRNPVIQPGNLALRNAWFCGGVEWNTGTTGHTPFTCSPVFTARLHRADGVPVLRMYEYERWRGITYQLDACLPEDSAVLLVHVTLHNPQPRETAIYWWSNIAVPEASDVRVIVPAEQAYHFDLSRSGLHLVPAPIDHGIDYTYTTNTGHAADYFFDIPTGQRPYITALDGSGRGLIQTSTARLKGRKLFFWGTGQGGQHWQRFLSPEGGAYLEIQAGLANTQLEHLPMPGLARWSWTEAYGLMEAAPEAVHGQDWDVARQAVSQQLETLAPAPWLEQQDMLGAEVESAPVEKLVYQGAGWGSLEERRRTFHGETVLGGAALPFPASALTPAQQPWLSLLETGQMRVDIPGAQLPVGWIVDPAWLSSMERWAKSIESADSLTEGDWLPWYYLGIARAHAENLEGAQQAMEASLARKTTPWSLRGLAWLSARAGDHSAAARFYQRALELCPDDTALWIEFSRFMIAQGQAHALLDLLRRAGADVRRWGRIRLLEAKAALQAGHLDTVWQFFADQVEIPDLREGEDSLSDLWYDYQRALLAPEEAQTISNAEIEARFPLPEHFDFRMHVLD